MQAVLGGSVTVPTLTGDVSVKVSLPPFVLFRALLLSFSLTQLEMNLFSFSINCQVRQGTQPGEKVALKGKGGRFQI